jgi:type II secretory pathway pseudopilin PulG
MCTELARFAIIAGVMALAGILGSYCRKIWERDEKEGWEARVIFPGVAAAFVVPLFLSIGGSGIFKEALQQDALFGYNLFIIAGFCILAGVAAPTFVNALAKQALNAADQANKAANQAKALAEQARKRAENAENIADVTNEAVENQPAGTDGPSITLFSLERKQDLDVVEPADTDEARVLKAIGAHKDITTRTIGGIVKESGLDRDRVEQAIAALLSAGKISEASSSRTASRLFRLKPE